jgi:two-component system sensor histidine kinase YesM
LEAIKTVAEIDYKYDISDYLTALGRLMRYSMHWSNIYVTLKEEIDHVRNYLSLMNLRCENKIAISIVIEDELLMLEILKMTIQPIVENAINHGLAPKNWQGMLEIRAFKSVQNLCIQVVDNGVGMSTGQLEQLKEKIRIDHVKDSEVFLYGGIGLKNVNERIKLFYGEEYGLKIESVESEYTTVWVILPYKKGLWG